MAASYRTLQRFLESLEPGIRREFEAAVRNIRSRAQMARLVQAIEREDLAGIYRFAGMAPGSWSEVTEAVRRAYHESGTFTMSQDVPQRFGMAFDWTNPRAEGWLAEHSSQLITWITEEQRENVQLVLTAGMRDGRNPRNVALDIVGRMDPRTKRREGGIIGLNRPQTEAALNARTDLQTLDSRYFNRKLRDRRFDGLVRRAIENGEPLTDADINRIVGRYEDRLLKLRGDTVARTEALQAMNEAADESLRQVIDEGLAPPDAVKRVWDATGDSRTRPAHEFMEGQERGPDEPFTSGTGAQLMHPGDGSLGAGAADIINCRCVVRHEIDFIAAEAAA